MLINPKQYIGNKKVEAWCVADLLGIELRWVDDPFYTGYVLDCEYIEGRSHNFSQYSGDVVLRVMKKLNISACPCMNDDGETWYSQCIPILGNSAITADTLEKAVVACAMSVMGECEIPEELTTNSVETGR